MPDLRYRLTPRTPISRVPATLLVPHYPATPFLERLCCCARWTGDHRRRDPLPRLPDRLRAVREPAPREARRRRFILAALARAL